MILWLVSKKNSYSIILFYKLEEHLIELRLPNSAFLSTENGGILRLALNAKSKVGLKLTIKTKNQSKQ